MTMDVLHRLLDDYEWQSFEVKGGEGAVTLTLYHKEVKPKRRLGILCGECDKVFPSARSRGVHLRVHREVAS